MLATIVVLYGNAAAKRCRFWLQDESRFGLKTVTRRRVTSRGVRPVSKVQWQFEAYWLYGLAEPLTGETFFLEFSHVNGACFQAYIDEFAATYPNEVHIIQLDRAGFHTVKKLKIPENIVFIFQPPHSPELNPIEQVWAWIKSKISWELYPSLDALKERVAEILCETGKEIFQSITGRKSLMTALEYAGFEGGL